MKEANIELIENKEDISIKEERNLDLDIMRIFACFMVIFLHVAARYSQSISIHSFNWKIYNFYDSCVRSSVPLFIMISGVFFLNPKKKTTNKELYLKYISKLLIIYLVWSIVYAIYSIYPITSVTDIKSIIITIIKGPYHFWYIPIIIALYVISPILKKITKELDKAIIKYFIILFMISCIIKTISCLSILPYYNTIKLLLSKIPIGIICQYYSYFLLGYFLYHINISKLKKRIIYILGIISPIICAILTFYISKNEGTVNQLLYDNFSIFTFFEATAIFVFFSTRKYNIKKYKNVICELSKCTLGIYLIHILILSKITLKINLCQYNALFMVPIVSIVIFIIALIIIFILRKIKIIKRLV